MAEKIIIIYVILINLAGFVMMGVDKGIAVKNAAAGAKKDKSIPTKYTRIPEAARFTVAFFLGGVGCCIGMFVFRHKTKKIKFCIGMPFMVVVNAVVLYLIKGII